MTAQDESLNILHAHVQLQGQEGAEPSGIEDAGHAEDPLPGKAQGLEGHIGHDIQRVGDHDDNGVRCHALDVLGHGFDDPGVDLQEIFPVHPGLPGHTGGYDEDVRSGCVSPIVGPPHPGVEAQDGSSLPLVQPLPYGHTFDDVQEDDLFGQLLLTREQGAALPYVAAADNRDLVDHNVPHGTRNGINTGTLATTYRSPKGVSTDSQGFS